MKTITVPGIKFKFQLAEGGGAVVQQDLSKLKESCPYCGETDCLYSCDESQAGGFNGSDDEPSEQVLDRIKYNGAIEFIERLVLTHAAAGIDVGSKAYGEAIESALECMANDN